MGGLQGHSPLSERLDYVVQPPLFREQKVTALASGSEIAEAIRPILRERLAARNYDRMFPVTQFLDHYEALCAEGIDLSPLEALKSFRFQTILPDERGGPCYSVTYDLFTHLPKGFSPYICLSQLPERFQQFGFPKYSHTAILIRYQNPSDRQDCGYVLLDPSFDIDEPLIIRSSGEPSLFDTGANGIWHFYVRDGAIICDLVKGQEKVGTMIYTTQKIENPIASSAVPMFLVDRRLSMLSRTDRGQRLAHIRIEVDKKRVIWDQERKRFAPITFQQIGEGWKFPEWFAQGLYMSQETLNAKIAKIVKHQATLNRLAKEYFALLWETRDFSVTGKLDEKKMRDCLYINGVNSSESHPQN